MDIELNCEEHGEGSPLIVLHGNGESLRYFDNQVAFFKADYRVIAVDTRGHGKSPRGNAPFTISRFAEDLNGFMIAKGMEKAHHYVKSGWKQPLFDRFHSTDYRLKRVKKGRKR